MQPFQKDITNNVRNAFFADEIGVENEVAGVGDFTSHSHARAECVTGFESVIVYGCGTENHVSALAQGTQGLLQLPCVAINSFRLAVVHTKQAAVVRVVCDVGYEFGRGWQPTAITIVVIFIEIIGDFLNQTICRPGIRNVQNNGARRGMA